MSKDAFIKRGEEIKVQLTSELEGVHTLHDLFDRQEALTLLFDELSKVAIEARLFQVKTNTTWEAPAKTADTSLLLAQELRRVLEIPGARSFLEKCQARGFERIDAFEKGRKRAIAKTQ